MSPGLPYLIHRNKKFQQILNLKLKIGEEGGGISP
jgi:hypothetical protein